MTIELDHLADDTAPPADATVRRGRQAVSAVLLVAVGAAAGGLATYRWQERRNLKALDSQASVVVLPDMRGWIGDEATPATTVNRQVVSVHLVGHVTVVNAGPKPAPFDNGSHRAARRSPRSLHFSTATTSPGCEGIIVDRHHRRYASTPTGAAGQRPVAQTERAPLRLVPLTGRSANAG